MMFSSTSDPIRYVVPNQDTYMGGFTFATKEAIQRGWLNKVGKQINFCGLLRTVKNVIITEKDIIIEIQ